MLQWFCKNYFSWAYLQLAAHKLMTCLGLSKSDWFGHSCKDQHDVWSRTDPLINFQSVSPLHVWGRSLQKRHCGALWLYSPPVTITRKDRPACWNKTSGAFLRESRYLLQPHDHLPNMQCVLSPSLRARKTRCLPASVPPSIFKQWYLMQIPSLKATYWSLTHFQILSCVYPSCSPPPAFLFWINFFQPDPE